MGVAYHRVAGSLPFGRSKGLLGKVITRPTPAIRHVPTRMNAIARILLAIALLGVPAAFALDPGRHITELMHRVWDNKSGAPADIRAFAQTSDGYLWVGSLRGLYRFNGVQFQKFEPGAGPRFPSKQIVGLLAVADNQLWIGYRGGGASVLVAGKLTNYGSADGFPEGDVRGFAQDRQGRIWAASSRGLGCFDGARWRTVGDESGFPGSAALAVLVDHAGALWVAGEHHIAVLSPQASKFELADEPYDGQVFKLAESPDGTVWMAQTTRAVRPLLRPGRGTPYKGLSRTDCQKTFPETWQTEPKCQRPGDLEVRVGSLALLFDKDRGLWITTAGDGLRRAPHPLQLPKKPIGEFSDALEHFTSKDGLSSDVAGAIFEDREGSIWVGTRDGIDQFRDSALAPIRLTSAAAHISIVPGNDGYVLAADERGVLFRIHDARHIGAKDPDISQWLYRDPFGSIWGVGIGNGCRFVGEECATGLHVPGERQPLSGGRRDNLGTQLWRLAIDGDHRLWAYVADAGLFAFEKGTWSHFRGGPPGLESGTPTTEYTDSGGRIWFGLQDGRLLTVAEGVVHLYSSRDGLALGAIKAVDSVSTHMWVGGENGLAVLRGPDFTPVLAYDGPGFGSVSGVIEADDGTLWVNENRGVLRISASEVAAILRDSSHATHFEVLNAVDGLPGIPEQYDTSQTAIRGTDGRLWFVTSDGVAWVDPRHPTRNTLPPPVAIESIIADGKAFAPSGKLQLPVGTTDVQIEYAGLSFAVPERVQFRYQLKGLERDWQNAGTRRTAYYTRLPPGVYDFQVMASNDSGVWNKGGAQMRIVVPPNWYQTWWFYALCALLLIAVLAALYRARLAQVRAETRRLLEARLSERERIARDLHDTLLQGMQGLIWRLQGTADRIPQDQPARQEMQQSLDRADELLAESRDRVKDLRPRPDEVADLPESLSAEGEQLAQQHSARFRVMVQGSRRELHPIVRDEAYFVAREALGNAFRHSGAKDIEAEVNYEKTVFHVRVRDDGRGISESVVEWGRTGHFGLAGMRERARKIGGHLEIWSKPDAGTEVNLQVPAQLAYSPLSRSSRMRSLFTFFRRPADTPPVGTES